ncbi:MAG TPA: GYD domain-containing protein [Xanthobacteraceae bacterium]|nr:GYD domain-containing protein [Xanthobacteraceae bacterium]
MPTFIITMNWTDQGIRTIKDAPKRAAAARELGKKTGVDIKQLFLTTGDSDLLAIVEAADGSMLAKYCLTLGALGNLRTKTVRAWPESEYMKMVSELP